MRTHAFPPSCQVQTTPQTRPIKPLNSTCPSQPPDASPLFPVKKNNARLAKDHKINRASTNLNHETPPHVTQAGNISASCNAQERDPVGESSGIPARDSGGKKIFSTGIFTVRLNVLHDFVANEGNHLQVFLDWGSTGQGYMLQVAYRRLA